MLSRVVAIARAAAKDDPAVRIVVATDDDRIMRHCAELGADAVMTPPECATGTDRAHAAVKQLPEPPDFVINMQGDAPLTPPDFIQALIARYRQSPSDVLTPVTQLDWPTLDRLRETKSKTPHSGTVAVFNPTTSRAYWFSKNILPAMRKEAALREQGGLSPVWRHVGIYGYSRAMLDAYVTLSEGFYEQLEGLEQLRVLEHGYEICCVPVDYRGRANMSGVDSPEDIGRAEALIAKHGELLP